tara:strand:+ start:2415 stop:2624 length:210 start_codon:yes stop_codon:yes gene_type:complete
MLDGIAKRYGVLPSHLMSQGDTFDLMVMDVALSWETHMHNKKHGKDQGDYDPEQLQEVMNKVRGNEHKN